MFTIGIDEVGRGSLAGPVTVAAVMLPCGFRRFHTALGELRDSKRLTPKQREAWYRHLRAGGAVVLAVAHVRPATVDRINISRAANRAALRACRRLLRVNRIARRNIRIYLDGGLFLGDGHCAEEYRRFAVQTVVKGDERFAAVAAASVVAKVRRDRLMTRLACRHPEYGFEVHKGYGTRRHFRALRRLGPSPAHRLTFLKKYHTMK